MLKIEFDLLKIGIALGEGVSTTGGPHCIRQPPIRSGRIKEWCRKKQTKWVRKPSQISINAISPADCRMPT